MQRVLHCPRSVEGFAVWEETWATDVRLQSEMQVFYVEGNHSIDTPDGRAHQCALN